jgi:hypothetical protein
MGGAKTVKCIGGFALGSRTQGGSPRIPEGGQEVVGVHEDMHACGGSVSLRKCGNGVREGGGGGGG